MIFFTGWMCPKRHWTCHIEVVHDRLQVSAWNVTDVSVVHVPADLVCGWSSSIAFSWPWTTRRSSLQINDCWQKSILLRWSVCMEQSSCISCKVNIQTGVRISNMWFIMYPLLNGILSTLVHRCMPSRIRDDKRSKFWGFTHCEVKQITDWVRNWVPCRPNV